MIFLVRVLGRNLRTKARFTSFKIKLIPSHRSANEINNHSLI